MRTVTAAKGLPSFLDPYLNRDLAKKISAAGYPSMSDAIGNYYLMRLMMLFVFMFAIFLFFLASPPIHPAFFAALVFVLFLICYYLVDMLLDREILRQRACKLQFLPSFMRFLSLYYHAGYSIDKSLNAMAQDIKPFYPLFTRLLNHCELALSTHHQRESAWAVMVDIIDVAQFEEISDRIQTREAHGYQVSEVLHHFSDEIRQELQYQRNVRIERLPVKITFISIFCFLIPMIVLIGSVVYFKLMDVLMNITSLI